VVRTTSSVVTLLPGVPMRDTLMKDEYDYYVLSVDVEAVLSFVLTPLAGDPDLFVTWGDANTRPNATNNPMWRSRLVGIDVITIYPTDSKACVVNETSVCNYYVGVTSYSKNASFSLLAYSRSADPVTLVDGQPQSGEVCTIRVCVLLPRSSRCCCGIVHDYGQCR
jgi:hypothetical protein